jgi:hypothetical protein
MGIQLVSINGLTAQNFNAYATNIRGLSGNNIFAQIQNVYRVEFNDVHYINFARSRINLNLSFVTEMRMKGCTGINRPPQGISTLDADTDIPTSFVPIITGLSSGQTPSGLTANCTYSVQNNICTVFFYIAISTVAPATPNEMLAINLPPNVPLGANQISGGGRETQSAGIAFTVSLSGTTKAYLVQYNNNGTMVANYTYVGSFSYPVTQA